MESFRKFVHKTRVEWANASKSVKEQVIAEMSKLDSDALVKMKTAARIAVRKGFLSLDEAEDFYEFADAWLNEVAGDPVKLQFYEKIAIVRFANEIKP